MVRLPMIRTRVRAVRLNDDALCVYWAHSIGRLNRRNAHEQAAVRGAAARDPDACASVHLNDQLRVSNPGMHTNRHRFMVRLPVIRTRVRVCASGEVLALLANEVQPCSLVTALG